MSRQRSRESVALGQLHARGPEDIGLEGGLDALGDNLHRSCLQQCREPFQPGRWWPVDSKLSDEQLIDLDEVEVAAREQCQIRARESRVIERSLCTSAWNAVECTEAQLVGYAALGNLGDELLYASA